MLRERNTNKDKHVKNRHQTRLRIITELFAVSAKLGMTSFGGPAAHLAYFHEEYVRRKKWLDERAYAELIALCQFLPGPASSQVGMAIGIMRGGLLGGIISFIGFTMPSVIVLVLFAMLLNGLNVENAGWIHGLKTVAVAVVAHAVIGMGQKLAPDRSRATIAIASAGITLLWQSAVSQVLVIALAALIGLLLYKPSGSGEMTELSVPLSRKTGAALLTMFMLLLLALPLLHQYSNTSQLAIADIFYRSGSLVFGGGHVVLPLLERELVPDGWLSKEQFLTGYGAVQAVPGPLFTFSAYLGAVIGGWGGALLATAAIFLPAFLLVAGALPFWQTIRSLPAAQGALTAINAAVAGLLLAALYDPIWTSTIATAKDFVFGAVLFGMLQFWRLPAWSIVITGVLGGVLLY